MSEVGGKQVATDLKVALPELRKLAEELRMQAAAAVTSFTMEAKTLRQAVKSIEDEASDMRQISNDLLGNHPPNGGGGAS